ncbi:TTK [Cordylochernes scorpioides]|uniref:TTK n=1 Tax=Cordylochernes scorpioides TaxID=51811 RepID=A0ABY6KLQ3_9ARAC|nr:TTK [Cordylochernes scorpioides]
MSTGSSKCAEDEDEEDEELSGVVEQSKNEEKAFEELASDEEPNIIDEFLSDNIPKASPIQSQNINLANKTDIKPIISPKKSTEVNKISEERIKKKPPTKVIKVNNHPYEVHSLLGKGGSSKVYQVYDLKRRTFAIKHVKMSGVDIQIQNEYKNEIELLKSLQDQDFVIKMYDYEYKENEILVVLEKGETDFQLLLQKMEKNQQIDWITIKYFWSQMLRAVHSIHQAGIIHSDLKPANFMMVEGRLKLIDFGIASKIQQDATSVVKDSQMGTINYMSPDAIMEYTGITSSSSASSSDAPKYRITLKCDIWSLGCILYKMVYKNPPFAHIRGIYRQIGAITNSKHIITFPQLEDPDLIDVLKLCLNRNPKARPSTGELLRHPYLTHRVQPSLQDYMTGLPQLTPAQIQQVFEYSRKLLEKSAVRFKAGRISIEDDPRQGRPKFQRTDENVQKITDLIKENPRTTLLELEHDTGISKTTIGRIVTKDLKLKKTPSKFIPRFLTNEQKLCRLATCENMLEMTKTDPEWKDKIITGD